MEFKSSDPNSIGIELELQLLNGETLDLVDGIVPLMELYPGSAYVKPEFIQNTVEIATKVCFNLQEAERHAKLIVADLLKNCRRLGMRLAGAGTHPFCKRLALITPSPRYLAIKQQAGYLAIHQIVYSTHVHIGMQSGDEAIAVMGDLTPYLPLFIALSANSPFWRGYDTGYATYRHRILAASRSYGLPPYFQSWKEFVKTFEASRRADIFPDIHSIHWDIRPRPQYGSLEVRVMDVQATVKDAVALAALIRAMAHYLSQSRDDDRDSLQLRPLPWWLEKENRFRATRLGLAAKYVLNEQGDVIPLTSVFDDVMDQIKPVAIEMGDIDYLNYLGDRVTNSLGWQSQKDIYQETGSMKAVVASLAADLEGESTAGKECGDVA